MIAREIVCVAGSFVDAWKPWLAMSHKKLGLEIGEGVWRGGTQN